MTWKTTWGLLGTAGLLLAFILLFERRPTKPETVSATQPRLVSINPESVTAIQLRRTNQFILRAERTNQSWNITAPISYPAQGYSIDRLLAELANLSSYTYLSPEELRAGGKTVAAFGLDMPAATLTLHHEGRRTELLFGAATPAGDMAYFQVLDRPGIYVVPSEVTRRIPQSANQWRDPLLLTLDGVSWDRFEVRSQGRGFALQFTNGQFYLSKPTPARADRAKVDAVLRKLINEPVTSFVADNVRAGLDELGFQPPEAELAFGLGTNDSVVVQFGKSPSNDVVYARRLVNNNVVLVSKSVIDAIQVPALELRDKHLLSFEPASVDSIEIAGEETFTVRRQGSNSWVFVDASGAPADAGLITECLMQMRGVEGDIEKDVVTDFGAYGLAQPIRRYVLKAATTNSTESSTNQQIAWLDIGGRRDSKVFARGQESTVYSVEPSFADRLPSAAWQLRDRRVWSFNSNQVNRLTLRHKGQTRQLIRGFAGDWKFESGSGILNNPFALEEIMTRLGELRAAVWVDRGEGKRQLYGFSDTSDKLVIELKNGDKPQSLTLEFGERAASGCPYALAVVDGQTWIFEFPLQMQILVVQPLLNQIVPPVTANVSP